MIIATPLPRNFSLRARISRAAASPVSAASPTAPAVMSGWDSLPAQKATHCPASSLLSAAALASAAIPSPRARIWPVAPMMSRTTLCQLRVRGTVGNRVRSRMSNPQGRVLPSPTAVFVQPMPTPARIPTSPPLPRPLLAAFLPSVASKPRASQPPAASRTFAKTTFPWGEHPYSYICVANGKSYPRQHLF